jgi:hypothetical protein
MGVNGINSLNLKTKHRISSLQAAVSRKTLRYLKFNFKRLFVYLSEFSQKNIKLKIIQVDIVHKRQA